MRHGAAADTTAPATRKHADTFTGDQYYCACEGGFLSDDPYGDLDPVPWLTAGCTAGPAFRPSSKPPLRCHPGDES